MNESMATEEVRLLELWSPESLRRQRAARGTQLRGQRQRLRDVGGRPLFSTTCSRAMSIDCVLDLAEACDYQGYRWYQCEKDPVKMVALCRKDGDKPGRREAGVEQITACTPQAVEDALKSPEGETRP